jgi:small conductance mechanosensitive channel
MWDVFAQAAEEEEAAELSIEVADSCADLGPVCDLLVQWTGNEAASSTIAWILGTPLKIAIISIVALLLNRFVRRRIPKLMDRVGSASEDASGKILSDRARDRASQRADTIGSLLRSLSTGLIFGVALLMILDLLGISLVPIIASAGVLGLAVGFGAQSVVEDFLRGLFMLGEDQFGVGDRVDVGSVNGYVERVTLRTTIIKDPNGTLWHIPNSEINYVANETQESSRAVIEVPLAYDADIDEAMEALGAAAEAACSDSDWQDKVLSPPQVRGVQDLEYDNFSIRVQVWVDSGARRQFERHLRRCLKQGMDSAGVPHPNTGYDVWMREDAAA